MTAYCLQPTSPGVLCLALATAAVSQYDTSTQLKPLHTGVGPQPKHIAKGCESPCAAMLMAAVACCLQLRASWSKRCSSSKIRVCCYMANSLLSSLAWRLRLMPRPARPRLPMTPWPLHNRQDQLSLVCCMSLLPIIEACHCCLSLGHAAEQYHAVVVQNVVQVFADLWHLHHPALCKTQNCVLVSCQSCARHYWRSTGTVLGFWV